MSTTATTLVSVIISSYQQERALKLVLAALGASVTDSMEVVIADDGSEPTMAEQLAGEITAYPFPIRWCWQEDRGFRKSRALDRAVMMTRSPLLVFLDADCIPQRDLVEIYRQRWQPGEFLTGGGIFMSDGFSARLDPQKVADGLHEHCLAPLQRALQWRRRFSDFLSRDRQLERPRLLGGNFAVCRELFDRVDGFDQVFHHFGKEDSDIRNRMRHAGARGKSLVNVARAFHLGESHAPSTDRATLPRSYYIPAGQNPLARRGCSKVVPEKRDRSSD